jgi:hypothetical protein
MSLRLDSVNPNLALSLSDMRRVLGLGVLLCDSAALNQAQ